MVSEVEEADMSSTIRSFHVLRARPDDLLTSMNQAVGRGFTVAPSGLLLRTVAESAGRIAGRGRRVVDPVLRKRTLPVAA